MGIPLAHFSYLIAEKNYLLHNNIVQVQIFFPEGTHPSSEITEIQGVGKV